MAKKQIVLRVFAITTIVMSCLFLLSGKIKIATVFLFINGIILVMQRKFIGVYIMALSFFPFIKDYNSKFALIYLLLISLAAFFLTYPSLKKQLERKED